MNRVLRVAAVTETETGSRQGRIAIDAAVRMRILTAMAAEREESVLHREKPEPAITKSSAEQATVDPLVLETIMTLFWTKGYEAVSMAEIVAAAGLNRYAIYARWGSKRALYLDMLDQYKQLFMQRLFAPLTQAGAGLPAIREVFDRATALCETEEGRRGCLMCTTLVEQASAEDPAFADRIERYFEDHRALFRSCLMNARRKGEIRAGADIESYADYLVGIMQGAQLYARRGSSTATVKRFFETALTALR